MKSFGIILLIRHSESKGNILGKVGYTHESDALTQKGVIQSKLLGDRLAEVLLSV